MSALQEAILFVLGQVTFIAVVVFVFHKLFNGRRKLITF